MNTLSASTNGQNLLTPTRTSATPTPFHGVSFVRRLACRRGLANNNTKESVIMMVTPHRTFQKDEAAMTPRKILPTMEQYQAQNIDLVHVGKYLISLQPENCRSLDFFFEDEKESRGGEKESRGDENNNAENTFPATSYHTPPRTNNDQNDKHLLLSPPPLPPPAKRQRVLFTAAALPALIGMPNSIPTLEQHLGSELGPTTLKPRNLNLRFGALANDTTLV